MYIIYIYTCIKKQLKIMLGSSDSTNDDGDDGEHVIHGLWNLRIDCSI